MKYLFDSYSASSGEFTIDDSSSFYFVSSKEPNEEMSRVLKLTASEFAAAKIPSASALPVYWGTKSDYRDGDILIMLDSSISNAEGFKLAVTSKNITVSGSTSAGIRYGLMSLLKVFLFQDSNTIGCFSATDAPDTKERTVMLDCARKYLSANWIKNYIREMAWMGYNTLELHLTEEQGIRTDIWDSNYFTSTNGNDFSWICGSKVARWVENCSDPDAGKYLKASEMVSILETAELYGIEVIPSFDLPGHSNYLTLTYRQYAYNNQNTFSFKYNGITYNKNGYVENGTTKTFNTSTYPNANYWIINLGKKEYSDWNNETHWRYNACVDVANPYARAFLLALVEDYADFFKQYGCKKFNLGADEVVLNNSSTTFAVGWDTYAQKHVSGGSVMYDTFTDFINEAAALLKEKDYSVRAFNDFLCRSGGKVALDPDIDICFWDQTSSAQPVSYFVSQGRTIHNCIAEYTYYVLRLSPSTSSYAGMDTRDPANKSFNFHHATADLIYNEWNPTRMYTDTETSPTISGSQLGGGYFLVWCDYAGFNTESQIWNGIDSAGKYNIRERMWSNIIKMWNHEINKSFSFTNFTAFVKDIGDFPGYISCSANTSLPEVSEIEPACLADHARLRLLLETKVDSEIYSEESYQNYLDAKEAAEIVDSNRRATQTEVDKAVDALKATMDALEKKALLVTIEHKVKLGDVIDCFYTEEAYVAAGVESLIHYSNQPGYKYKSVEGATLLEGFFGTGGITGSLIVNTKSDCTVTIWYEPNGNYDLLLQAISEKIGGYSYDSVALAAYNSALENATDKYLKAANKTEPMTKQEVDEVMSDLQMLQTELFVPSNEETWVETAEVNSSVVSKGKKAVFIFDTSADVKSIKATMNGETVSVDEYYGSLSTDSQGDIHKNWYISISIDEEGMYTYDLSVIGNTELTYSFDVECK
ncbi:MAG: family 20 glycosylhydrolase [Eubacteriales bacterium]|nr:family 20 glycosylhydrolase [Eubacteriales bacterium]